MVSNENPSAVRGRPDARHRRQEKDRISHRGHRVSFVREDGEFSRAELTLNVLAHQQTHLPLKYLEGGGRR